MSKEYQISKEQLIEAYYTQGMTLVQVAAYFKTSTRQINHLMIAYRLKKRSKGGRGMYFGQLMPAKGDLMRNYHDRKMTITELAALYKVAPSKITRWLDDMEIPRLKFKRGMHSEVKKLKYRENWTESAELKRDEFLSYFYLPTETLSHPKRWVGETVLCRYRGGM